MSQSVKAGEVPAGLTLRAEPAHAARAFRSKDHLLAFCGLVAAIAIVVDGGTAAAPIKLIVWLVLPGWAVIRWLPIEGLPARCLWTASTSVVLTTVIGVSMGWSGGWYPRPVAALTLLGASALIVLFPRHAAIPPGRIRAELARPHQIGFPALLPWLTLGTATVLWGFGMAATDASTLDDLGLLSKFPTIWYVGVGLVVMLCIWGVTARRLCSAWFMGSSLSSLVIMLYASASMLTDVPRLQWTYKHIAVTDFISAAGRVDPSIDIYNRWPGFFSAAAFLGEALGYRDALDYASGAEITFALVDVLIVVAIARVISTNPRVYWTVGLVFALTNWVNQNYFAPQAFGFTLYLIMCLTALTYLRGLPNRRVLALEDWWSRRRDPREAILYSGRPARTLRWAAVIAVLVLQGVISVSHQLTPYMAALGLLPLFLFGFLAPRWVGPLLVAVAIIYLLPNLEYIEKSYGLFSGVDFLANASSKLSIGDSTSGLSRLQEAATKLLSGLTALLALMGYLRHFMRGEVRSTLMVTWLAAAPLLTFVGQSYGGEGRLRVYLFALPWLAIGVAWLFWAGPVRTRRGVFGAAVSLAAMALLFTGVYFQPEQKYRVADKEVIASKWLDARAEKGDLIFQIYSEYFPLVIGKNYPIYLDSGKTHSLQYFLDYAQKKVGPGDIENYIGSVRDAPRRFIVFSDSQQRYAVKQGLLGVDVLPKAEQLLVDNGNAVKVFDNGPARIYRLYPAGG